jgi:hypothetical protein
VRLSDLGDRNVMVTVMDGLGFCMFYAAITLLAGLCRKRQGKEDA